MIESKAIHLRIVKVLRWSVLIYRRYFVGSLKIFFPMQKS